MADSCPTILPDRDSRGRGVHIEQYKNMKTKMKRQGSTELPRFAVGALAIAGASAANAASVVQITFANNVVSSSTGLTLFDADLSGDEAPDVTALIQGNGVYLRTFNSASIANAQLLNGTFVIRFVNGAGFAFGDGVSRGLVGFNFSDNGMNGVRCNGFLDQVFVS